ncbi:reverse transcriptase domain-containing protein [Pseudomonas protegens]|uniref:reverse transcriptase domain-containing protein n=1 Tax=Pseudomonas protegens TaxID=380021 RepID=UPI00380A98DE
MPRSKTLPGNAQPPVYPRVCSIVAGVTSPLLANPFLHYAFDVWVARNLRSVRFCRYADDGVVHCKSLAQAKLALDRIGERFRECGLELHPGKAKIVYCQDVNRRKTHPDVCSSPSWDTPSGRAKQWTSISGST